MEENTTPTTPEVSAEASPQATTEPITMESGGSMDSSKLGWVAIMMLGLTTASLIYSIHYYRKKTESIKRGELTLKKMKEDIQSLKQMLTQKPNKNKARYGRFA
jgi:hypothetical protein